MARNSPRSTTRSRWSRRSFAPSKIRVMPRISIAGAVLGIVSSATSCSAASPHARGCRRRGGSLGDSISVAHETSTFCPALRFALLRRIRRRCVEPQR